jgi:hypothetical protein
MIVYQLPNGKCVYLTVEQFLSLEDDDIKYLVEFNFGNTVNDPFSLKADNELYDEDVEIDSLDIPYNEDDEPFEEFDINSILD